MAGMWDKIEDQPLRDLINASLLKRRCGVEFVPETRLLVDGKVVGFRDSFDP